MWCRCRGRRLDRYAAATINRRLAAVSGLFAFRAMRDPGGQPGAEGAGGRRVSPGNAAGCWRTSACGRSAVRRCGCGSRAGCREALDRRETAELLASLRTWRDRAIAGLMLFCGLRSAEVLALDVADVDIGGRWLRVTRQGRQERRVPLDVDVAGVIQTYLLAERPETTSTPAVRRGQRAQPRPAADPGRAAHDLPLSPG